MTEIWDNMKLQTGKMRKQNGNVPVRRGEVYEKKIDRDAGGGFAADTRMCGGR